MGKRFYGVFATIMIVAFMGHVALVSCSSDDDSSDGGGSSSNQLVGIWYESLGNVLEKEYVGALRVRPTAVRYNEDEMELLKSDPDKFFEDLQDLPYKMDGNVIYGIDDEGKIIERTRTVFELSDDKKTLKLNGYFNGIYTKL